MRNENTASQNTAFKPQNRANGRRHNRNEPNPMAGNFILMPSLLDYLSPDLTLPEQYFALQANDDGMGSEKALMYAVLKDGIRCFYKHVGATRRKYRKMSDEAEEWLMEDTWDYPFAFTVICDTLGIDADCLRSKLVAWKNSELERRRMTGDTKSVQVGRSPFPSPMGEGEGEAVPASISFSTFDEAESETDDDAPTKSEGYEDYEHMSLEELRLEDQAG